ncbi:MAG TPA: isoamylase early set domain-containing protein [Gemmatimonadaceae bacterium]|nr:isoamylase early set domain-containing protein [Gemmatimonadaceae bacterium]
MRDEHDELIGQIVDELKALPAVPADATARVLARVDAARRGEGPSAAASDDDIIFFPAATDEMAAQSPPGYPMPAAPRSGRIGRRFMVSLPAAVGYALAATLAGFLIRGVLPKKETTVASSTVPVSAPATPGIAVRQVVATVSREAQEVPVAVQFVLDAARAKSVAVVGDFNAWDGSATQLVRDSASGVWSAVVDVPPGRHVYAFLVDGKTWTLDPRAPKTKDSDYGTEQSVMIVGLK